MIARPGHGAPEQSLREALDVMREHDDLAACRSREGKAGRHPHRARHPLREEPRSAESRADDEGARHGAARRPPRARQGAARTSTASRSCSSSTRGKLAASSRSRTSSRPSATRSRSRTSTGRLRVGAAIGPGADRDERAEALVDAGVDVIVVDTAHGHSTGRDRRGAALQRTLPERCRSSPATSPPPRPPRRSSTPAPTRSRSASGRARICTTRVVAGVGVPQITAMLDCARRRRSPRRPDHRRRRHQVLGRRHQGDRRRRVER